MSRSRACMSPLKREKGLSERDSGRRTARRRTRQIADMAGVKTVAVRRTSGNDVAFLKPVWRGTSVAATALAKTSTDSETRSPLMRTSLTFTGIFFEVSQTMLSCPPRFGRSASGERETRY